MIEGIAGATAAFPKLQSLCKPRKQPRQHPAHAIGGLAGFQRLVGLKTNETVEMRLRRPNTLDAGTGHLFGGECPGRNTLGGLHQTEMG